MFITFSDIEGDETGSSSDTDSSWAITLLILFEFQKWVHCFPHLPVLQVGRTFSHQSCCTTLYLDHLLHPILPSLDKTKICGSMYMYSLAFVTLNFSQSLRSWYQSGDALASTSTTDFGSRGEEKPKQYQSAGLRDRHIDQHMWTAYIRHCTC